MNNKKFHNWIKKEIETEAAAIEQDAEKNAPSDLHMADDSSDDLMSRIRASQGPKRRTFHIRPRILAAAAAAASLVIALGIGASGERLFTPEVQDSSQNGEFNMLIFNGDEKSYYEVTEEEAYQEIEERIGIQALRLGYKPQGMELIQTRISEDMREAQMEFSFGDQILTIYENKQGENASFNIKPDGIMEDKVENFFLEQHMEIIRIEGGEGRRFYVSQISYGNASYYLSGDLKEEDFKTIISEIFFKSM